MAKEKKEMTVYFTRNILKGMDQYKLMALGEYGMYVRLYGCRFQNVVLRCQTPRLHCFLSSHWPSFRFLSFMAILIPSIQFFFGLPRALFCFGTIQKRIDDTCIQTLTFWRAHVKILEARWVCNKNTRQQNPKTNSGNKSLKKDCWKTKG